MNRTPMITAMRLAAVAAVAIGLTLTPVGSASAHVRVTADSTAPGSSSALTFRVPNESDTASTTTISVELPQDTPFASVSTQAIPGWTTSTQAQKLPQPVDVGGTTITQAIRTVTWTASNSAEIGPGEYQEFSITVGPLPAAGTIELPTAQTYSDGEVIRWDQPVPANGDEPDHPAPTLVVTEPTAEPPVGAAAGPSPSTSAPDHGARGLAAIGLVVGLAGLVVAALALRRRPTP